MSSFIKILALLLVGSFSAAGAATTNKTPILRGLLQSDLDGGLKSVTNALNLNLVGQATVASNVMVNGYHTTGSGSESIYALGLIVSGTGFYTDGNLFTVTTDGTLRADNITAANGALIHGPFQALEGADVMRLTNSGTAANSLLLAFPQARPVVIAFNPHSITNTRATIAYNPTNSYQGWARLTLTADGDLTFRPNNFAALVLNDTNAVFGTNVSTTGLKVDGPLTYYDWAVATNGVLALPAWNTGHGLPSNPGIHFYNTNGNEMGSIEMWADHAGASKPETLLKSQRNIAFIPGGDGLNDAGVQMGNSGNTFEQIYLQYDDDPTGAAPFDGVSAWPLGRSKRLGFASRNATGVLGDGAYSESFAGILGKGAATNIIAGLKAGADQLGSLWFYSSMPQYNSGNQLNTYPGISIGHTLTNGWYLKGALVQEGTVTASSAYAYDFQGAYAQIVDAASATVAITTTKLPGGTTNYQDGHLIIRSGPWTVSSLTFPAWVWMNEAGTLTAPSSLAAGKVLDIRLGAIGADNTNILASYTLGTYPFAYDTDASAFFTAASISDATMKLAVNNLVIAAKAHGWWTLCDSIYPFVGGNSTAHSKDLKAAHNITWSGTITHDANGVKGNGTTGYGDTGYNTSSGGGVLTQNSAHLFCYLREANPTACRLMGHTDSPFCALEHQTSGLDIDGLNDAALHDPAVSADLRGNNLGTRTASGASVLYYNDGANSTSTTTASTGLGNGKLFICARESGGSAASFSDATFAGASFGAGISSGIATLMFADWRAYQTTLGGGRKVP